MRIIARMPDQQQVGALVDSLQKGGFDRKDMIISSADKATDRRQEDPWEMAEVQAFVKTEREGLWEAEAFAEGIAGLKGRGGIIVAVETPKHEADRVRSMMKQSGAIEIIQD
ncbi:hypothetical protein SAMN05660649_02341 [Desulfotomaculum arcticum]|uniref:Uncharacterized protein n=1 Tax=Desulfotruncus arcticus DSM 17038 TaxID=1121424 RepID=A0A1I2TV70_9FIRM|nr:hypothetical protein [Desulfotruncus arcticus]SFG66191.1 hypothetical protein SAMN05660649_02341 [Desulfotomaculum arcticum] [Desulfotruncus arcticus DSM 17038]